MAPELKPSSVVPGRYPPPGTSAVGDAIRERRGERGITPLDAALLHAPPIAQGFNTLMGAVRTKGNLPGDVRELIILRVAALNKATFEWIHHEHIGRSHGLTTGQLYVIRDTDTPLPPAHGILTPLQSAALIFAQESTRNVKIPRAAIDTLHDELRAWVVAQHSVKEEEVTDTVHDLYVEAAMVCASYNMVSRFLLAADVGGISDVDVPWPVDRQEHFVSFPISSPDPTTHVLHALTIISSPSAPWVVLSNSLLTDLNMWSYIVPFLLTPTSDRPTGYNILLHSQRGHGLSTLPPADKSPTTITTIATEIADVIKHLVPPSSQPVHSVIGVSQGGAATLALAADSALAPLTSSIVSCDTSARTPSGNKEAWEGRVALVYAGAQPADSDNEKLRREHAQRVGMPRLAGATLGRWFPPGSPCSLEMVGGGSQSGTRPERTAWVGDMIESTPVRGFEAGAGALSEYDILSGGLLASTVHRVLLVAGSLDGGGKVGSGLKTLASEWDVKYEEIEGAGHLPMIDVPERFWKAVSAFLAAF